MTWGEEIRARFPDWGTDTALERWPAIEASLKVGQTVSGEVIARAPFGVWVDIGVGHPALLLVPEMAGAGERRIRFEDYPVIGEGLEARVVSLGPRAEISLTQKEPPYAGGPGCSSTWAASAARRSTLR